MSRVGTSNKGFTLIELVLVLFILGLILATVSPRLPALSGGDLKGSSRQLIRTVQLLMNRATSTKHLYRLNYDLEQQEYWASVLGPDGEFKPIDATVQRKVQLRDPVRIQDVHTLRQGKVIEGEAFTQFYPTGMIERTLLHLTDDEGETLTLIIQPMTGRVKVLKGYIEEHRL